MYIFTIPCWKLTSSISRNFFETALTVFVSPIVSCLHFCFIVPSVIFITLLMPCDYDHTVVLQWWEGLTSLLSWLYYRYCFNAKVQVAITFWQWLFWFSLHHCTALWSLLYACLVLKQHSGKQHCSWDSTFLWLHAFNTLSKIIILVPIYSFQKNI